MSFTTRYLDANIVEQLNHLQLTARSVVEGTARGLHRSHFKGASVEFRQHRAYVPGDEPRRLDWRVLARTGRPFVKEYDEETNLRCTIILDCSGSMGYAGQSGISKFDFAGRLVAGLAYLMLSANESVGLVTIGDKLKSWLTPNSGSVQLSRVIKALEGASATGPVSIVPSIAQVASQLGRRALVVVISDFFSPLAELNSALARLHHNRHELICLRVLHPDEISFPFQNSSLLQGLENERPLLCEPAVMRRNYLDNFDRHSRALASLCRSISSELHLMTTDHSVADSITHFLKLRSGR